MTIGAYFLCAGCLAFGLVVGFLIGKHVEIKKINVG